MITTLELKVLLFQIGTEIVPPSNLKEKILIQVNLVEGIKLNNVEVNNDE
ncbi:TPA: hypothetical protein QCR36_002945 [Bacillus cereus]|uniref:Uncharacterized protein n=1 Tax=Bacillus thuringiensis TaxID=1428 RepID=A0A437SQ36_BACTU|nr:MULTISPECIES: hypothetical protein [Bacillus]UBR31505.1 hypothetical protein LCG60_06280 [Bacillus sp. SD-4]HDR4494426.1 hypothetical protein [Bacillus cereus biovar anthracis]ADK05919.1 hypothetical protein BACI_c33020 [Bacillus cereus biovar anthracis str. CI]EJQ95349.1 hypothetical protein IGW_01579 [Bacillus cereus ISP3191]MBE3642967.1 hypothetical protein [Bacillus anthracis]